ncbi:MAG: recombination protein RecR [Anaerolineae bacterium]|nr:recombination protein RecR [Anaerolineae bacterium]
MALLSEPIARLIDEFSRLPGIGPKTASRLTYYLLRAPKDQANALAEALVDLKERTILCARCFNVDVQSPCAICRDESRDQSIICVVEEPLDLVAIERSGRYKGLYHVLHGAISPVEGIGPEDIRARELVERLREGGVSEVLLATNPNMEGEATAMYLARLIRPLGIRVTRLARGLPMGGDLEYADEITLARALEGRSEVE